MKRLVLLLALAGTASQLTVAAPAPITGVSGTVSSSPARPGPQLAGVPDTEPMVGALVRVRDARGNDVAQAVADERGHFTLPVPAGRYEVSVDVQGAVFPRCSPAQALVREGKLTTVQIVCDSGVR
jgi:subtilisin family serine protease